MPLLRSFGLSLVLVGCSSGGPAGGGATPPVDSGTPSPDAGSASSDPIEWLSERADRDYVRFITVTPQAIVWGADASPGARDNYVAIRSRAKADGAVTTVAKLPDNGIDGLDSDGEHAYFSVHSLPTNSSTVKSVYRAKLPEGAPEKLRDSEYTEVLVDQERVYFDVGASLIGLAKAGGAETAFEGSSACMAPKIFARSGDRLFVQDRFNELCVADAAGGPLTMLTHVLGGEALLAHGGALYAIENTGTSAASILRLSVTDGAREVITTHDAHGHGLATTDGVTFFYTVTRDYSAALYRFTKGQPRAELLARSVGNRIAVDESHVYVSASDRIGRIAKTAPALD